MILETIRESNVHPKYEVVPRVVGSSIPCRESDPESYFLFMLAHFSPFSADHDIKFEGANLEAIFNAKSFSLLSKNVMKTGKLFMNVKMQGRKREFESKVLLKRSHCKQERTKGKDFQKNTCWILTHMRLCSMMFSSLEWILIL